MGYRSDVAISVYKKDFDQLCKEVSSYGNESNVWYLLHHAEIDINGEGKDAIVTMIWIGVKWYDGFEDVGYIMNFIHSKDRKYAFKRIGESDDDYEAESNEDDWVLSNCVYLARYFERGNQGKTINIDDYLVDAHGEAVDAGIAFDDLIGNDS